MSLVAKNKYTVQPNGSVIVGSGLIKKWRSQIRGINPALYKRLVKIRALPKGKIKGMGKSGNSIYKISGGAVMGGGLFGRIFRAVKRVGRRVINKVSNVGNKALHTTFNVGKDVLKGVANDVKRTAVDSFKDLKNIRKSSDLLKLADKLKTNATKLTTRKYWARRVRNTGLNKIGLGKRKRRRRKITGGSRMLGAGSYARAPNHISTAILI